MLFKCWNYAGAGEVASLLRILKAQLEKRMAMKCSRIVFVDACRANVHRLKTHVSKYRRFLTNKPMDTMIKVGIYI